MFREMRERNDQLLRDYAALPLIDQMATFVLIMGIGIAGGSGAVLFRMKENIEALGGGCLMLAMGYLIIRIVTAGAVAGVVRDTVQNRGVSMQGNVRRTIIRSIMMFAMLAVLVLGINGVHALEVPIENKARSGLVVGVAIVAIGFGVLMLRRKGKI